MSETQSLAVHAEVMRLTAEITAAWARAHKIHAADLPALILDVEKTLRACLATRAADVAVPLLKGPAVNPAKSVFRDYIVCIECGARKQMLKRHLRLEHDLSPEEYRTRWSLPATYPLTAPDYSKTRSRLAKQMGLGKLSGPRKRR